MNISIEDSQLYQICYKEEAIIILTDSNGNRYGIQKEEITADELIETAGSE